MTSDTRSLRFAIPEIDQEVSALLDLPENPRALLLLAHGAGAGMQHRFFEALVPRLTAADLGVFRYQFPYMEKGRRAPDRAPKLEATVRAPRPPAGPASPHQPRQPRGKN
ncbi:MAG: alpha/beta family hydrolase, partial [Acidobacteriota bacterium]